LKLGHGADQVVWEHDPEFVLDELGHLLTQKWGLLGCRQVTTPFDVGVFRGVGPRLGRGVSRDAMVSPMTQEACGGVINVIEGVGQVGSAPKREDEVLPGLSGLQLVN
jgi:hypothetical protein